VPCPDVFVQDVLAALDRKGLVFQCFMDPNRPAMMDASHRVRVNYETYLFATAVAREVFHADVVAYCGLLTDPVSKRRFRPDDSSPFLEHENVLYYFERVANAQMFASHPEQFQLPAFTM
jgi:YHS domain-containing protein